MSKLNNQCGGLLLFAIVCFLISYPLIFGCAQTPSIGAPVNHSKLVDGVYDGSYRGGPNKALVRVTIKDNKIVNIEIVEHQAWKGKQAELAVLERIIASQSTHVDAVSGATNSSLVIMNAVQKAIEQAYHH